MNDPGGIRGKIWVVGDHNNSVTFGMNAAKFLHNKMGIMTIKVAGWFVGKNNFRS